MTVDEAINIVVRCLSMSAQSSSVITSFSVGPAAVDVFIEHGATLKRFYHSVIKPPGVLSADEVREEWSLETPLGIIYCSRKVPPTAEDRIAYCKGDAAKTYKLPDRLVMELTGRKQEPDNAVRVQGSEHAG